MGKKSKNIESIQNTALFAFERTIRSDKYRTEPTMVESIIAESAKKRAEWERKAPQTPPFISFYNPNNPLNGFASKSKDEQKAILKMLKAQEKSAKSAQLETANC